MKRIFVSIYFLVLYISCFTQEQTDKFNLEVYPVNSSHDLTYNRNNLPKFILGIRNWGDFTAELDQQVSIGQSGDNRNNDLTFELYYVTKPDSIDILNGIFYQNVHPKRNTNKVFINSTACYFIEFSRLNGHYLTKSGLYKIRFTLLQKYAPRYLTKDISTDWIYFNYQLAEDQKVIEGQNAAPKFISIEMIGKTEKPIFNLYIFDSLRRVDFKYHKEMTEVFYTNKETLASIYSQCKDEKDYDSLTKYDYSYGTFFFAFILEDNKKKSF